MTFDCVKTCEICGKKFIGYNATKFCGLECSRESNRRRGKIYREKQKAANIARELQRNSKTDEIINIAVKAKEAGMTYGQYVARMGL